jgi:hypothetical protein
MKTDVQRADLQSSESRPSTVRDREHVQNKTFNSPRLGTQMSVQPIVLRQVSLTHLAPYLRTLVYFSMHAINMYPLIRISLELITLSLSPWEVWYAFDEVGYMLCFA